MVEEGHRARSGVGLLRFLAQISPLEDLQVSVAIETSWISTEASGSGYEGMQG
jgi:hypothetical protein